MSWLWGSRDKPQPEAAAPPGHHSLALKALLDGLVPDSRHSVLDLGPPLGSNLEFLSSLSCRVRIADLHRSLGAEPFPTREPEAFPEFVARLLPLQPDERFEAVLTWDLFNYLRPDQIAALVAHLAPACLPRCRVFVLLWTHVRIPAAPLRYRIRDHEHLVYEGAAEEVRPGPRYAQPELTRAMPGFRVELSYVLRNGIQEYVCLGAADRAAGHGPGSRARL